MMRTREGRGSSRRQEKGICIAYTRWYRKHGWQFLASQGSPRCHEKRKLASLISHFQQSCGSGVDPVEKRSERLGGVFVGGRRGRGRAERFVSFSTGICFLLGDINGLRI